jgi:hypothetical protein
VQKQFRYVQSVDTSNFDIVESTTTETGRVYKHPEGKKYPSITTVMSWTKKDVIKKWRAAVGEEQANKITKAATTRGTSIHDMCEKYLKNDPNYYDPSNYTREMEFSTIKQILDRSVDDIFCLETALYSDHLGVAGKTDCIAHYNGQRAVIDFKTARKYKKKEYIDTYFMQAAAYAIMFEELTRIPIPNIVIMINVAGLETFVFEEKRDNYAQQLRETIREYKLLSE